MGGENSKPRGPQVAVLPPEREGESGIYRDIIAKDKLVTRIEDDVKTLYEAFKYHLPSAFRGSSWSSSSLAALRLFSFSFLHALLFPISFSSPFSFTSSCILIATLLIMTFAEIYKLS